MFFSSWKKATKKQTRKVQATAQGRRDRVVGTNTQHEKKTRGKSTGGEEARATGQKSARAGPPTASKHERERISSRAAFTTARRMTRGHCSNDTAPANPLFVWLSFSWGPDRRDLGRGHAVIAAAACLKTYF